MPRNQDQNRIRHAQIDGAVAAIHDLASKYRAKADESRAHWPELWEKFDALFNLIREV
jgi:hypothetical protein